MEVISKEEKFDFKTALKIGARTLVNCFIVIMFVASFIFVAFPRISLKMNNLLGLKKIKELNYQMIYERSGKASDLYNVILYECEMGDFDKELAYIDEMIARNDYADFCEGVDKASLESVKDKNLIPYSVNVNGYLLGRKVVCLYNLDLDGLDSYVYRQTKTGKLSEYSFTVYADLIYSDESLTKSQKQEKFRILMEMIDSDGYSLEELLETRVQGINDKIKIEDKSERKISLQYTLTRIYRSRYYVYDILGDEMKKQENNDLFVYARLKLNEMINL